MVMKRFMGITAASLLILTSTVSSQAGLFDSWNCHMPITVPGYKDYEPLTNFPLLVVLNTNLPAFNYKQFGYTDGRDLRFTDASGTNELTYEVDHWDTKGNSYIWVRIPVLQGTYNTNYFDGQWIKNWSWTGEPVISRTYANGVRWAQHYEDNGVKSFVPGGWLGADGYPFRQQAMFADEDPATGWTFASRSAAVTTGYVENQLLGRWIYNNAPMYLHFYNGYRYASDSQNGSGGYWDAGNLSVLYYTTGPSVTNYLSNITDRLLFTDIDPRTTNNPIYNPSYNTNTQPIQIIAHWGNPSTTLPAYTTNGNMWSGNSMCGVWHMREAAAKDSKHSAADGTPSNITVTNGRFGSGLYFNGSLSSAINFGSFTPGFSGNGPYTLEGWFYRTANSGASIAYGDSANLHAAGIGVNGSGQYTSIHNGTDETFDNSTYGSGQWQHVVVVHHGDLGGDSFSDLIYINGRYSNSRGNSSGTGGPTHDSATSLNVPASGSLSFGKSPWGTDYTGTQIMDEIRIHKAERTYNWIEASYQTMASNNTFQTYAAITGLTNTLYGGTNPPGAFQFGSATYGVNETGRFVDVSIQRPLDAGSNVTVQVTANGGTAVAGTDYVTGSSTISMGDGENTATFRIYVANNALDDGDRTISLALSSPTGGATITSPSNTTVTIQDDDSSTLSNVLLSFGTMWKYFNTSVSADPGATWAATNFNDSSWSVSPAALGYAAADDVATVISYGSDGTNKIPAYYFRKAITIADPSAFGALTIKAKIDDGCLLYINGTEVSAARYLMTNGAVTYQSFASSAAPSNGRAEAVFYASSSVLKAGTNEIAVEVHQVGPGSSDIYFDLQLEAVAASTNSNFTAYNDASWQSGDSLGVTSAFTTFSPGGTASGTMISEAGDPLPGVTVSMTTNASVFAFYALGGFTNIAWATGQDAATEFEGKIGRGYACEIQNPSAILTTTISGLATGKQYKLAVWCSRLADGSNYSNRLSEVRLASVDSFINTSTSTDGVTRATTTLGNDTTIIRATYRIDYAPIVRYEQVRPGTDGTIQFSVRQNASSAGNAYLNAFKLVASDVVAGGDGDSDGMDDTWEQTYFGGTGQANGGASQDWDNDGFDNYSEYRAGTDPTAPGSKLEFSNAAQATGNGVVITWSSATGKTYSVQQSTNLLTPWNVLVSGIPATPPSNVQTASIGQVHGYIRVKVE